MTIIYVKQKFPPAPFDIDYSHMQYYRDLYEGNHKDIFPRAEQMAADSQPTLSKLKTANYRYSKSVISNRIENLSPQGHYVVVNISSAIAELPADLINRSLGNVSADEEDDQQYIDFISKVANASKLKSKFWAAIVQHQVDGAVAYRIRRNATKGTWFEWTPADLYFEHEDDLGADVAWIEERDEEKYLRVERQRLSPEGLTLTQMVFIMKDATVNEEIDFSEFSRKYELDLETTMELPKISELLCGYLSNDETLLRPRGRSALRNVDIVQEEINWTITRDSIVFEKHGKPKLAIPKKLWDTVAKTNEKAYGGRFVRGADLEVVSYDENNGAVPMYITWNAQTEQSFKHVERLITYMLAVSKTSPTAVGLGTTGGNLSAKAILYEWIQSVIKSESIKDKFDSAIKEAIRKCTILENYGAKTSYPEIDPVVEWNDMLPKAEAEKDEEESKKFTDGVQSLETTVRNIHPDWSEESIEEEVDKIREEKSVDTLDPTYVQPPVTKIDEDEDGE